MTKGSSHKIGILEGEKREKGTEEIFEIIMTKNLK